MKRNRSKKGVAVMALLLSLVLGHVLTTNSPLATIGEGTMLLVLLICALLLWFAPAPK